MKKTERKMFSGTVSIYRSFRELVCEVKTDCGLEKTWYGVDKIPNVFFHNIDPLNNMNLKITFEARMDLSYVSKVTFVS